MLFGIPVHVSLVLAAVASRRSIYLKSVRMLSGGRQLSSFSRTRFVFARTHHCFRSPFFFSLAQLFSRTTFAPYYFSRTRCKKRRVRKARKSDRARAGKVRLSRVARAASREHPASVFKLPVTRFAESAPGVEQQFSVSSNTRQCRVVVTVKATDSENCAVSCSDEQCQT